MYERRLIFQTAPLPELGTLSERTHQYLPAFCRAMAEPLAELVRQVPQITERDLHELPLLTFGSQLQGSNNTQIGKTAMRELFVAIKEIVKKYVVETTETRLTLKNSAGRTVLISLPMTQMYRFRKKWPIRSITASQSKSKVERISATLTTGPVKRKNHIERQGARFRRILDGHFETRLELSTLRAESPTTNHWFDVAEVLARKGRDWDEFRERMAAACAIPVSEPKRRR